MAVPSLHKHECMYTKTAKGTEINRQKYRQNDRMTDIQTVRQTGRQTDIRNDRYADN